MNDENDNKIFTGFRVIGGKLLYDGDEIGVMEDAFPQFTRDFDLEKVKYISPPVVGTIKWSTEKQTWLVHFRTYSPIDLARLKGIEKIG
jgi:hypothetical protein